MTKRKQKDDVWFFVIEEGNSSIAEFGTLEEANEYIATACIEETTEAEGLFRVIKGKELIYLPKEISYPVFEE